VKISKSIIQIGPNLWAYLSRSGKSLEFYVRGESAQTDHTTHHFRISFAALEKIKKVVHLRGR
jgi:hypothetical protein